VALIFLIEKNNMENYQEESVVTFETAKLLNELGYENCVTNLHYRTAYYNSEGVLNGDVDDEIKQILKKKRGEPYDKSICSIPAPTQSLVQKWLREKYHTDVVVDHRFQDDEVDDGYKVQIAQSNMDYIQNELDSLEGKIIEFPYSTYEDALEAGIIEVINIIKMNKYGNCQF
jgi:hypothetical protein